MAGRFIIFLAFLFYLWYNPEKQSVDEESTIRGYDREKILG